MALQARSMRGQRAPPGAYLNYQQRLIDYNCAVVAQLHNSTTGAQRQAARAKLKGWEQDLRALATQQSPARIEAAP